MFEMQKELAIEPFEVVEFHPPPTMPDIESLKTLPVVVDWCPILES